MTAGQRHRCGRGILQHQEVQIRDEREGMVLMYLVPGFACDACGEELIDRETQRTYEATQTPLVILTSPSTARSTTELPDSIFGDRPPVVRTPDVEVVPA